MEKLSNETKMNIFVLDTKCYICHENTILTAKHGGGSMVLSATLDKLLANYTNVSYHFNIVLFCVHSWCTIGIKSISVQGFNTTKCGTGSRKGRGILITSNRASCPSQPEIPTWLHIECSPGAGLIVDGLYNYVTVWSSEPEMLCSHSQAGSLLADYSAL